MKRFASIGIAFLFATSALAADEDPIENARLPRLWKVVSRTKVPEEQVAAIAKKLGVEMTSLENDVLDAGGIRLQVNLARCSDAKQAEALWRKFTEIHGGERDFANHWGGSLYAACRGVDVAEIVCGNRLVAQKAQHVIGWNETLPRCHVGLYSQVSMRIAPLESGDGMRWNRLFNLLASAADARIAAAIEEEAKAFRFADRVALPYPWGSVLTPKAVSSRRVGDTTEFTFDALPREHGVPVLAVEEHVPLETFGPAPTAKDAGAWTGATAAWPIDAPEARAAVTEALGKDAPPSPRERVERLLVWVHDHVKYGGQEVGSRYGVVKVLQQGFGHCWDQSDVFVTLCRAAGVPARQAGGWLVRGEGHVWAEVRLGDEGDLAVDPGTTWLGVSSDYVRLWVSDDGRTPFVYWGAPKIDGPICIR
jgi:hypothetical protein